MKPLLALMLWMLLMIGGASISAAADRDAADRQTRQESDELRTDMRQHRLKKIQALDDLDQPQGPAQQPKSEKVGTKPNE